MIPLNAGQGQRPDGIGTTAGLSGSAGPWCRVRPTPGQLTEGSGRATIVMVRLTTRKDPSMRFSVAFFNCGRRPGKG